MPTRGQDVLAVLFFLGAGGLALGYLGIWAGWW